MPNWIKQLKYDPIAPLLASGNTAIVYRARKELLSEQVEDAGYLWAQAEPQKILRKQRSQGCWKSSTRNREKAPAVNYELIETYKQIAKLIDMFEMTRDNDAIERAAEYIFSCQTDEGDIRGFIGNQYAPYYTGIIISLLIKAGYGDDPRIKKGFDWLLSMRQNDGGWVIGSPGGFGDYTWEEMCILTTHDVGTKRDFDWTKPFAHSGTGMVIRAFACHPQYRTSKEAHVAAQLLTSHFFKKDNYASYQSPEHWVNFKYPFWWTDLVSALDSVSLIGIPKEDDDVNRALRWLVDYQQENGLWKNTYSKIHKAIENARALEARLWISLAICTVFRRYFGD